MRETPMKYRALLVTEEKLLRPLQSFSNEISRLRAWAGEVLRHHKGVVKIYEMTEKEVEAIERQLMS